MRGVSLLLAAEDNPLVKKFCDNVYPYLPEDLQRYYNAFFAMKSPDLTKEATEEVCKNVLYCQEYATQPDFNADSTMEVIDKVLPDIKRVIEYSQSHPMTDKTFYYCELSKEINSLIERHNLPSGYFALETLRAYCKGLKVETLKHTFEQPSESADDIEPPDYVLKVFQKAINEGSVALSEKPINGKKRFLFLLKNMNYFYIDKDKFPYVTKDFLREWLYDKNGKQRSEGYYKSNFTFETIKTP